MAADPVRIERDGGVASIVLDSGPLNLFGEATFDALIACLDEIESSDARALVWRAEGEIFSGGVDVNFFQQIVEGGDAAKRFGRFLPALRRFEALPIPTLALVHGICLTAAFEIALACDMIWAGESAQMGLVEATVGLTPGTGTPRIAERAGPARARELVMTGGLYPAERLEHWNVINRVVPDGELLEKGMRFAHRLADGPTLAHAATKRIVRAWLDDGIAEADQVAEREFIALFETEDTKNGFDTFVAEGPGKATFQGR